MIFSFWFSFLLYVSALRFSHFHSVFCFCFCFSHFHFLFRVCFGWFHFSVLFSFPFSLNQSFSVCIFSISLSYYPRIAFSKLGNFSQVCIFSNALSFHKRLVNCMMGLKFSSWFMLYIKFTHLKLWITCRNSLCRLKWGFRSVQSFVLKNRIALHCIFLFRQSEH